MTGRKAFGGGAVPWILVVVIAVVVALSVLLGDVGDPQEGGDPAAVRSVEADRVHPETAHPREPVTGAAAEEILARAEEMRAATRRYQEECVARLEPASGPGIDRIVSDCITRLSDALDAVVASDTVAGVDLEERLARYQERARQLRAEPPGEADPARIRGVLRSAADLLGVIGEARYSESLEEAEATGDMRAAVDAMEAGRPLSTQKDRLQRYFLGAEALLSAMARPGDPGPGG